MLIPPSEVPVVVQAGSRHTKDASCDADPGLEVCGWVSVGQLDCSRGGVVGLPEAVKALIKARSQLERVQVAGFDPPDPVEAVTFAFYGYENAIVAAAEAKGIKWTKNHYEKAKLARKLCDDAILTTDVQERLLQLNDLRKDVAYGEPGAELEEVDLEDLASDLEHFIDEVEAVISSSEEGS